MTNRELLDKANNLRISGQTDSADKLYDQLISLEPDNDEFIFYKAMNVTDSNPVLAIYLFKKAVEINPRKTTISNITAIAYQSGNYDLAILVFNDLLKKYPDNLEIFYNRAAVLGNKGEYLKCILDFYFIVDNTQFSNDAEAFLRHQIAIDIALCKTNLRNESLSKPLPTISNQEKLSLVRMKEYHYTLPASLYMNEIYLIDFGKNDGLTIKEIIEKQPEYISWCIINLDNFCVSEDVIELVKQNGVNMNESEKVNLFKLKIYETQRTDQLSIDKDGNIII